MSLVLAFPVLTQERAAGQHDHQLRSDRAQGSWEQGRSFCKPVLWLGSFKCAEERTPLVRTSYSCPRNKGMSIYPEHTRHCCGPLGCRVLPRWAWQSPFILGQWLFVVLGIEPGTTELQPKLFLKLSLSCLGWPWTCNSPVSPSQMLGLQVWTTTPCLTSVLKFRKPQGLHSLCLCQV
jgi:hypothetical protein